MKATIIKTKQCSTCSASLPVSAFNKKIDSKDGYRHDCKSCQSIKRKSIQRAKRLREECSKCSEPAINGTTSCVFHSTIGRIWKIEIRAGYVVSSNQINDLATVLVDRLKNDVVLNWNNVNPILHKDAELEHIKPISTHPELAYEADNISWCHKTINDHKGVFTVDEFSTRMGLAEQGKRKCSDCDTVKDFGQFYKDKTDAFERSLQCKQCRDDANREYHEANPDYIRKYREANREYFSSKQRAYRAKKKQLQATTK